MKKNIHPKYYSKARIQCSCGAIFEVGSTKEYLTTEICSCCHPFYTGQEKLVDVAGQIGKFKKRLEKSKIKLKKKA